MKRGEKIEYDGLIWVIEDVYRSFIHVSNAKNADIKKYIYKVFYKEVKVVNE